MDIKSLLLQSVSEKKVISGSRRVHFGKFSFIIKYEIKGKYLSVIGVKRVSKVHWTFRQRLKRRRRLMVCYKKKYQKWMCENPPNLVQIQCSGDCPIRRTISGTREKSSAVKPSKECQTIGVYKIPPRLRQIQLSDSSQQTIASARFSSAHHFIKTLSTGSQTERSTQPQSTQCQPRTNESAAQTDEIHLNNPTPQVWQENFRNFETQCSANIYDPNDIRPLNAISECCRHVSCEKEAVIYMLSEIGELVLNQNHMLHTNSQLLNELSDTALLNKQVTIGRAWSKKREFRIWRRSIKTQQLLKTRLLRNKPSITVKM
ncbi:uncharacterized protein ACN2A1_010449 [Glossina fuscipes fuscipes]